MGERRYVQGHGLSSQKVDEEVVASYAVRNRQQSVPWHVSKAWGGLVEFGNFGNDVLFGYAV